MRLLLIASLIAFGLAAGCARIDTKRIGDASEGERAPMKSVAAGARVGEHFKFSVRWLGLEVGTADVKVEGIEQVRGRDAYHISVHARSSALIDLVYPVRDEHHTYIDVEYFHSLRYEKKLSEGRYRADEKIDYFQEEHKAVWTARKSGDQKELLIPLHVQDQLSCGFWFRAQAMKPGDVLQVPVNADEKNWNLEIQILQWDAVTIKDLGTFEAVQVEPMAKFQGIFVRRGRMWCWMSADEKRIPLMMKTKVPILGTITVVLADYSEK